MLAMTLKRGWRLNHFIILAMGLSMLWFIMYYVTYGTGISPTNTREVREQEKLQERLHKVTTLLKENHKVLQKLKSDIMDYRGNMLNNLRSEISAQSMKWENPAKNAVEEKASERKHVRGDHPEPQLPPNPVAVDNVIPVIITACNRPSVSRCLDRLMEVRGNKKEQFPIMVSQDCGHKATADVLHGYGDKITYVKHDPEPVPSGVASHMAGYYKISSHYKFALSQAFSHFPHAGSVIILEDDIEVSPDFLSYFLAMDELLKKDDSLWCASAWNDNGLTNIVDDSKKSADLLYRSDFFPGLGWLLKRTLWESELARKWPQAFWDDWMRDPAQRKGRACIRPEVSRTSTFGKEGVSGGQFFNTHLKYIKLNEFPVDWSSKDLTYLTKENYDKSFKNRVYGLPLFNINDLVANKNPDAHEVRIEYTTAQNFKSIATKLGLMTDFKAGVPRTAYMGIVTIFYKGRRVFVAPPENWDGYNEKWS